MSLRDDALVELAVRRAVALARQGTDDFRQTKLRHTQTMKKYLGMVGLSMDIANRKRFRQLLKEAGVQEYRSGGITVFRRYQAYLDEKRAWMTQLRKRELEAKNG